MICRDRIAAWLQMTWWLLFPSFLGLVVLLTVERACGNPYDLLPALTSNPGWAWPIALLYVLVHLWVLAAYLVTVSHAKEIFPDATVVAAVWGRGGVKIVLMIVALAIEYSPSVVSRLLATALGCRL
jgi:hypothetical protein